jgi:tetratricopeptide (TPR) repeat protein
MKKITILLLTLIIIAAATSFFYHHTQQAQINYYQAHRLFLKNNYNLAIPYYQKSLRIDPSQPKAQRELAYSYLWTKKAQQTLPLFEKLSNQDPENNQFKLGLVEAYTQLGNHKKTIALLKDLISEDGNQDLKIRLATAYFWQKQFDKAKAVIDAVLQESPDNASAKLLLARIYYSDQQSERAVKILKDLIKEKTELPAEIKKEEIEELLAKSYLASGQRQKAIDLYQRLVSQNPKAVNLKIKLAEVLSWAKQFEKSEKLYREIIRKNPRQKKIHIKLVELLIWQNKHQEAIDLIDSFSQIKGTKEARLLYGKALLFSGKPILAKAIFKDLLVDYPKNLEIKRLLADAYAYSKNYKKAIFQYRQILESTDQREAKQNLAQVLSWDKQYQESIKLYDQLLTDKYSQEIKLQKARVLGWSKNYQKALEEYKGLLNKEEDLAIRLEMEAKDSYWQGETKNAINKYQRLLTEDPENVEAAFDLSQIYAYQGMWEKAIRQYKDIIDKQPLHFRAKEGLEKVTILYKKVGINTDYLFFEADSSGRTTDIKKHQISETVSFFINKNINLEIDYDFAKRSFSDFSNISENQTSLKITYQQQPDWSLSAHYGLVDYYRQLDELFHLFGVGFSQRIFDRGRFDFNYQRQRLTDNSQLIRTYAYRQNFQNEVKFDLTSKLKFGLDCSLAYYFDQNFLIEPGISFTYYLSKEPRQFYLQYRYFFKEFKKESPNYWTPRGFSTNKLTLAWRHYLNNDELFFGADQLYYQLKYEVSLDSDDIIIHKFSNELNWDINKRLNFYLNGSFADTTSEVYQEKRISAGLKYYF